MIFSAPKALRESEETANLEPVRQNNVWVHCSHIQMINEGAFFTYRFFLQPQKLHTYYFLLQKELLFPTNVTECSYFSIKIQVNK